MTAHLADVLIVEAIRFHANHAGAGHVGWLRALVDPRIGRALHSFHANIAQPLDSGIAGSAFGYAYRRFFGTSPGNRFDAFPDSTGAMRSGDMGEQG